MAQSSAPRTSMDNFATAMATAIVRWRWLVIVVCLLLVFAAASGGRYLEFVNNYRVFFSEANPELQTFDSFQDSYSSTDSILIVLQVPGEHVLTPELAQEIEWLSSEGWKVPYATRVDSLTNFQFTYAQDDELIVEDLIEDGADMDEQQLREKEMIALAEPLLRGNLISDSARTAGINITLSLPGKSPEEIPAAAAAVRDMVAQVQQRHPDLKIALSGIAMLNNAFGEASQNDLGSLVPLMYLLLVVMTIVVLRSFLGSVSTLIVVALSSVVAMGLGGYTGIPLTPVSVTAPTIIMTLAIADSIHILVAMLAMYRGGMDKHTAIIESIRVNLVPVTMTSLTTMVGFLTLNFSDAPPYWHLGNLTAMGIVAAWLLSIILLPALLAVMPLKVPTHQEADWPREKMARAADWVIAKHKSLLLVGGIITVILTAAAPTLVFNDEFIKYFSEDIQFRRDADFTAENLSGVYVVEYNIKSGGAGEINSPEYLQNLEAFANWLREQPEVNHVYSYTDIIKRLNRNMHDDDSAYYTIPDDKELAAQYLLLYEFSLPFGFDLQNRISLDKSSTRLSAIVKNISSVQMQGLNLRAKVWQEEHMPAVMQAKATGTAVMFAYISKRNIESMMTGNVIAVIAISVIMLLLLRSLYLGFISLLANALPIIMMFGFWALTVGQVGMIGSTIAAATLGIVVDDTVHFLSKYLRGIREHGYSKVEAVRYTFETVGVAIISTTIILIVGFSILLLSDFQLNAQTGLLSSITILIALLFDFFLLPSILLLGSDKGSAHQDQAA